MSRLVAHFHADFSISNFRVILLANPPEDKVALGKEQENNNMLLNELDKIRTELTENTDDADNIRIAFIYILNGVLQSFEKIKGWANYYPDLSQGMIIPGYLFGKILNDFKNALESEGSYKTPSDIFMSPIEWNYDQLQSLMENIQKNLFVTKFSSKLQAINYYEELRKSMLEIVESLREETII